MPLPISDFRPICVRWRSMARLVETVRQARPELVVTETFAVALETRLASARAAWRDVQIDGERFAYHIATRLEPPVASLDQLHVEDLYLACGCLDGLPVALAAFDRGFTTGIDLAISAAGLEAAALPDIRRRVRERLVVKIGDAPPKLATYSGKGSLGSWVRIFAMREAQRLLAQTGAPPG
jgi:RNA polymerase sigma-70 factor (ECF subfamily)